MRAGMQALKLAAIPMILVISGCGSNNEPAPVDDTVAPVEGDMADTTATGTAASTNLLTAEGADAGTATLRSSGADLVLTLQVKGLPPGEHGAHVHTTGTCEAPSFESAGGHWNPANKQHGLENPQGQHAGDMPNLVVAEDGTGTLEYTLKGGTIEGLLDADGAAMVVHADPDDQKTDPAGDSGARIACGVFSAS